MRTLGLRLVICTDILARGIDLPDVRLVINFDPANSLEEHIHRAGRVSRWAKNPGLVINFDNQGSLLQVEEVIEKVKDLVNQKDADRVDTRLAKEIDISEQNVKAIENIEVCE